MNTDTAFIFREITEADISSVQSFIIHHLNLYFNANRPAPEPHADVLNLRSHYLHQPRNLLLGAWNNRQQLIATLAVCQYDDRIPALRRRQGIGSQLVLLAEQFCDQQQYKTRYLHTHHFLPGGYQFWLRNHFTVYFDEGGEQQIVHMEKHQ